MSTGDPASRSPRERKRRQVEDRIVDAAFALFVERGFDTVTVDEIAQPADIGRTTVFRYFSDKQEVVFARDFTRDTELPDDVMKTPAAPATGIVDFGTGSTSAAAWAARASASGDPIGGDASWNPRAGPELRRPVPAGRRDRPLRDRWRNGRREPAPDHLDGLVADDVEWRVLGAGHELHADPAQQPEQ